MTNKLAKHYLLTSRLPRFNLHSPNPLLTHNPLLLTMSRVPDLGYNDQRYDGMRLEMRIPSLRRSVHLSRECDPDPAKPRSYVCPDGILPPLPFAAATESPPFFETNAQLTEPGHRISYREDRPTHFQWYLRKGPISLLPLFKLSEDTIGKILSYLTGPDLAALAFVDRDSRQLARTRQFRSVWINFSKASMELLRLLIDEACEVHWAGRLPRNQWRLGACIRRITVCSDSVPRKMLLSIDTSWIMEKLRNNDAVELHACHMNALEVVLRVAVPNLEFLDWRDSVPITPSITRAIIDGKLTRLELHNIAIREDFAVPVEGFREKWTLRSLLLSVYVKGKGKERPRADIFTASILRLAAPTLEELVWQQPPTNSPDRSFTIGEESLRFPKLKKLQLRWVLADDTVWSALIPGTGISTLTQLLIDDSDSDLGPLLARRGLIASLTHLTWIKVGAGNEANCASFIAANPQLKFLRYEDYFPDQTDNDPQAGNAPTNHPSLLPVVPPSSFHALASLSLVWAGPTIPTAVLRRIATITTLEHLYLSAGSQDGFQQDWAVDHKVLRKRLRPLKQLKWLALTQESYASAGGGMWGFQALPGEQHRDQMMQYALLLATGHPLLEWVYLGKIPIAIERRVGAGLGAALPVKSDMSSLWGRCRFLDEIQGEKRSKDSSRQ